MTTTMSLHAKLFTLKQKCPQFAKDKMVKAGKFSYNYAPLDRIDEVLKPLCGELKLHYYWASTVREGSNVLTCVVLDVESGDSITSSITFASSQKDMKQVGGEMTYYSRYLLYNLLGIVTTEDTSEDEEEEPVRRQRPARAMEPDDDDDDDDEEGDDEEEAPAARRARPGRSGVPARSTRRTR